MFSATLAPLRTIPTSPCASSGPLATACETFKENMERGIQRALQISFPSAALDALIPSGATGTVTGVKTTAVQGNDPLQQHDCEEVYKDEEDLERDSTEPHDIINIC